MQLTAIATVAVTIVMLGSFLFARETLSKLSAGLLSRIEISVFLSDSVDDKKGRSIAQQINADPRVSMVEYIPKAEGLRQLRERLHGEIDTSLLTMNPLPNAIHVRVKDPEQVRAVADSIQKLSGVGTVQYAQDAVAKVLRLTDTFGRIGLVMIAALIFAAAVIIANTIRLTVFARRREIAIMQLVGATNGYIRGPFLAEGLMAGALGAILAIGHPVRRALGTVAEDHDDVVVRSVRDRTRRRTAPGRHPVAHGCRGRRRRSLGLREPSPTRMTAATPAGEFDETAETRSTVLIVDDDPDLRTLLAKNLEHAGFSVLGAPDGQTALDTLEAIVPDVVVIDVLMPNMNGFDLTRRIREIPSVAHVPIIILTALTESDDIVRGLDAGADDYLVKPFGPPELLARVRAKLRRSNNEASLQPLTRLPGNIAIDRELSRRLRHDALWALLYVDMDNFKAFNDVYGFIHGDEAIVMLARTLLDVTRRKGTPGDFVGHIGGDDFVVITTPEYAEAIAEEAIAIFDRDILTLYSTEDAARQSIVTKDRRGNVRTFPIMSISIGIITNEKRQIDNLAKIGEIAAELKHFAKSKSGSVYVKDQRLS